MYQQTFFLCNSQAIFISTPTWSYAPVFKHNNPSDHLLTPWRHKYINANDMSLVPLSDSGG